MNKDRHKYFMFRILSDIFKDDSLSRILAFKGGTSLMFFHSLPRFSVDLDFNILDVSQTEKVYDRVRRIALKYGGIADEQMKHFGPIIVLNYGKGERNLKLEMSTRCYDNHYEIKNLGGTFVRVMAAPDMFAHKLCALLDRGGEGLPVVTFLICTSSYPRASTCTKELLNNVCRSLCFHRPKVSLVPDFNTDLILSGESSA
jgi:hypothetical protein